MNPYPGQAAPTVNTSGAGSPGVIVSAGGSDPNGSFPTPVEATGNDARTAANIMAPSEALADRTNWAVRRIADPIYGGDYRTGSGAFQAAISVANAWTIDRSALTGGAASLACLSLFGPTGAAALSVVQSANQDGIVVVSDGNGIRGKSNLSGAYGVIGEGLTSGAAGVLGAGNGTGPGVKGVAGGTFGTPALIGEDGPLWLDTSLPSPFDDTGDNMVWANQLNKCWADVTCTGATGLQTVNDGVGIDSVSQVVAGQITVVFARPMANDTYHVDLELLLGSATLPTLAAQVVRSTTGFVITVILTIFSGGVGSPGTLTGFVETAALPSNFEFSFAIRGKHA